MSRLMVKKRLALRYGLGHALAPPHTNPAKDDGINTTTTLLSTQAVSCACGMKDWGTRGLVPPSVFASEGRFSTNVSWTLFLVWTPTHHDSSRHHTQSMSCIRASSSRGRDALRIVMPSNPLLLCLRLTFNPPRSASFPNTQTTGHMRHLC